jgi:hypothetical protein
MGEIEMMIYAVRKRRGQWSVCSDESVLLHFETYDEAIETVRSAVGVLSSRQHKPAYPPLSWIPASDETIIVKK